MGLFAYLYFGPAQAENKQDVDLGPVLEDHQPSQNAADTGEQASTSNNPVPPAATVEATLDQATFNPGAYASESDAVEEATEPIRAVPKSRRFSFRFFAFNSSHPRQKSASAHSRQKSSAHTRQKSSSAHTRQKSSSSHNRQRSTVSSERDHAKRSHAATPHANRLAKPLTPNSADKRAKQSAVLLRSLMVGSLSISPTTSKTTRAVSKPQLNKIKVQLMQPKSANRVIAQLRALPVGGDATKGAGKDAQPRGPIHAVCLEYTEEQADRERFSRLAHDAADCGEASHAVVAAPNVATASISTITDMFQDMNIINLINAPDLGLGQPGDGQGLLAGALPTAETVISGVKQITPQLMALGFATSRVITVDHQGIYPPTDRMSVLTYWWGLELVLPPPTLLYLANAQSISSTVMNFLSALALINNGVREILPFVRYIAQFIDFEFNSIRSQNKGNGVVCAATWIMPAAMVPRPWDFAMVPLPGPFPLSGNNTASGPLTESKSSPPVAIGPGALFIVPVVADVDVVAGPSLLTS